MIHSVKGAFVLIDQHLVLERIGAFDLGDVLDEDFAGGHDTSTGVLSDVKNLAASDGWTGRRTTRPWRGDHLGHDGVDVHWLDIRVRCGRSRREPRGITALAGRPKGVEHVVAWQLSWLFLSQSFWRKSEILSRAMKITDP